MKILTQSIFLLLAIFFLSSWSIASCGTTKYHMVKNHKPRQSTLGFSVTPPPGSHWYERLKNGVLVYFKIDRSKKSYAISTEAREVQLERNFYSAPDFLSYVKKEKNSHVANGNLKNTTGWYRIDNSLPTYCVRYQQQYDDYGMKGLQQGQHVDVNNSGLFCLHPENPEVAIDISYVEKSFSDAEVTSYKTEGEMFLASLTFHQGS